MKELLGLAAALTVVLFISTASAWSWSSDCKYTREIEREVSMSEVTKLIVIAGAGSLDIQGESGRDTVLLGANLCADTKDELAVMDVSSESRGDSATIETEFMKSDSWTNGDSQARIDLKLLVPARLALDVKDSSGVAEVANVAALTMVDSSGELQVKNIAGDVDLTDSSGALEIEDIGGGVVVTDSSGGIDIRDVKRDVLIKVDSSGGIDIKRVDGNVVVQRDTSGGIEVDTVGGDFVVGADTSGGISHEKVSGKVSLPN